MSDNHPVLRGADLPHTKLTEDDVRLIRELIRHREQLRYEANQITNTKLAEKFEVHRRTIDKISTGANWRHLL